MLNSRTLLFAALGAAGGAAATALVLGQPATAQQFAGLSNSIEMAAASAGEGTHAWALDPRTGQVIFCASQGTSEPKCLGVAIPGTARP